MSSAGVAVKGVVASGLPEVGAVPWGTHLCHFYRSAEDLRDVLVPYFQAGLRAGERCIWVTSEPLPAVAARDALADAMPELAGYERRGQIEIRGHRSTVACDGETALDVVRRFAPVERAHEAGFGAHLTKPWTSPPSTSCSRRPATAASRRDPTEWPW